MKKPLSSVSTQPHLDASRHVQPLIACCHFEAGCMLQVNLQHTAPVNMRQLHLHTIQPSCSQMFPASSQCLQHPCVHATQVPVWRHQPYEGSLTNQLHCCRQTR